MIEGLVSGTATRRSQYHLSNGPPVMEAQVAQSVVHTDSTIIRLYIWLAFLQVTLAACVSA